MKRTSAQAGEGKLESRFAALTSGLLARKGHAAPSNSPIADPAEETDAFALEPTYKTDKKKAAAAPAKAPPPPKPAAKAPPPPPPPAKAAPAKSAAPTVAPAQPAPAPPAARAEPASAKRPAPPAPAVSAKPPSAPLTVINERSDEAGYPDNPSPEEIAALEAEADEVVSYFENFGNEDAVAIEKDSFYGDSQDDDEEDDDDLDAFEALDDLDVLDLDEPLPPGAPADAGSAPIAGPWAGASVPPVAALAEQVRAGVSVQLTAREFMRLSLGAAELEQSAQQLIVEAIEEYLDARGVLSLGGCSCLEALTKKPGGAL